MFKLFKGRKAATDEGKAREYAKHWLGLAANFDSLQEVMARHSTISS